MARMTKEAIEAEMKKSREEVFIPVTYTMYSTVKVTGVSNIEEALEVMEKYKDDIPLGDGEYVDGSYEYEKDEELLVNVQKGEFFKHIGVDFHNPDAKRDSEIWKHLKEQGLFDEEIDEFLEGEPKDYSRNYDTKDFTVERIISVKEYGEEIAKEYVENRDILYAIDFDALGEISAVNSETVTYCHTTGRVIVWAE